MGVTREQLEKLKEPIPYKYRLQSAKYGKATVVSYVDSRQVQDKLDADLGPENWETEFKVIDDNLFCGISVWVNTEDGLERKITKWDVGSESNVEKDKGSASDAFKRASVHWGIGRFLYSLGIITLNVKKHTNDKEYPATRDGKILWNSEDLNAYCKELSEQGILDDTRPRKATTKAKAPAPKTSAKPTTTSKTKSSPKDKLTDGKGGLTPSKEFQDDDSDRRAKAIKAFGKLGDEKVVMAKIIKETGSAKHLHLADFVNKEPIDKVLEIYTKIKG